MTVTSQIDTDKYDDRIDPAEEKLEYSNVACIIPRCKIAAQNDEQLWVENRNTVKSYTVVSCIAPRI